MSLDHYNDHTVQPAQDALPSVWNEDNFRALVEMNPDSIMVLDTTGKILHANQAATRTMEYESTDQLLHVPLADVLSDFAITDEAGQVLSALEYPVYRILAGQRTPPACVCQFLPGRLNEAHCTLPGERVSQVCLSLVNKRTGRQHWGMVWSWPVMNAQGSVSLVVSVFRDITEFKELEERKDAFIRRMSHELRTPLTNLSLLTAMMCRQLKTRQDEPLLLLLDRIENQHELLACLVDHLLDLSSIQSGKLVLHMEPFDLSAVLHEVVKTLQRVTPTHTLILECPPDILVVGDKGRIKEVGFGLLTNAIKYSRDAYQVIVRGVAEPNWIHVSVQDFGVGIAEAHLPNVFEPFYQGAEAIAKTFPGLGIGLYLCREIIKEHHGYLWVESKKGQGSTFSFSLPVATRAFTHVEQ